jgi:cell division protein ZapA (FtsZ GTPase activity inhibitor)
MAKVNSQLQGVVVQIFGEEYQIAESDAIKVQKIASYVDGKMREIAELHSGRIPTAKLAVLAAMTIADELMQTVGEQIRLAESAQESLQRLTALVDERASMISSPVDAEDPVPSRRRWRDEAVRKTEQIVVE